MLYIFSPYLKGIIERFSKKELSKLIITICIIYFGLATIPISYMLDSYIIEGIVIYLIGAYINKYKETFRMNNIKRLGLIVALIILLIIVTFIVDILLKDIIVVEWFVGNLWNLNSPIILLISILIFNVFKDLNIKENRITNKIASTMFGVYLFHENIYIKDIIWKSIVKGSVYANSPWLIINSMIGIIGVLIACIIIEFLIQNIIQKNIMKLLEKISKKLLNTKFVSKIKGGIKNIKFEM